MNFAAGNYDPHRLRIYGGVGQDIAAITVPLRGALPGQSAALRWAHIPMGLIDLPFSILFDTLTLPWTVQPAPAEASRSPRA
jgi:hypothetical protein